MSALSAPATRWTKSAALLAAVALLFTGQGSAQPTPSLPIRTGGIGGIPGGFPVGPNSPDLMAAHFINVGQGSSALFEFSCGAILIDTGGQREATIDWRQRFADYLNAFFARRSDLNRLSSLTFSNAWSIVRRSWNSTGPAAPVARTM